MKAVQFSEFGGPEVLQVVYVSEPHPGPGEVRTRVQAAGASGIDWKIRAGDLQDQMLLMELPAGTSRDASGVIDEVGDGVIDVKPGDAGFGSGTTTFAEYAVLHSWARKPDSVASKRRPGSPVPVETANRIIDRVGVQPGQTLLISGAAR